MGPRIRRGPKNMNPCIMGQLSCRCCGKGEPAEELIHALRRLSILAACTIWVNSCCRCEKHNKAIGGEPNSYHCRGMAADIVVQGVPCSRVWAYLNEKHRGGLGRYDTFTHVDVRGFSARWDLRKKK